MTNNRNFDNRTLFWGDNIDFMRAMNSETVDLIATDPPFNKGRDFHATPDSLAAGASFQDRWKWDEESHPQFTDALRDDTENEEIWTVIESARASWGDDMGAFMCFMGVRLMEMHRLLKPTGSIYLHCDPTASHYLKTLMDAIFGRENFRNEIVWHYNKWTNTASYFQRNHDTIFWYAKSHQVAFNKQYGEPTRRQIDLRRAGYNTGSQGGRKILRVYDREKAAEQIRKAEDEGRAVYYVDEPLRGAPVPDVWDIAALNGQAKERMGYPTQKPLALYERIIRASSNPGDMVLDPFAGCATTCVAAERLERQWVGIDLWEETQGLTASRLESEKRMFALEHLTITQTPPERTDDGEVASPDLRTKTSTQLARWQRLFRSEMFDYLAEAQSTPTGLVTCAGCGRKMEREFMELDHIMPKKDGGENYITNRILLCRPCNGWKSNMYTLSGLQRENKRRRDKRGEVWMQDEAAAQGAQLRARRKADEVREELG